MTIDSRYIPEKRERDSEVEYPFTFESIGETAVKVYLVRADGARVLLTLTDTEFVN